MRIMQRYSSRVGSSATMPSLLCAVATGLSLAISLSAFGGEAGVEFPPHYGAIAFPAQPLPWTAEAWADFGALLSKLGDKAALDPASVRASTSAGELLATRFVPDRDAADRGVVRWNVPAMPKEAQTVEFRIHLGPRADREWEPVRPDEVPAANLVPNGGLEQADPSGKKPAHWKYAYGAEMVTDPGRAHAGQSCVTLPPHLRKTKKAQKWRNATRTPGTPGVVVEPNKLYSFRYCARTEGAALGTHRLIGSTQVYWYDAKSKYLAHSGFGRLRRGDTPWQEFSIALRAPVTAHYAMMITYFYSTQGVLYLDDFVILPARLPQIDSARTADGSKRVTLGVDDPAVRRFDFGKDDSAPWPKFEAVTMETAYTKTRGFGWTRRPRGRGVARALPDDLARDSIVSSQPCRFAVDLPDGDYFTWLLIGDNGLGESIIPTYVNWAIKVGGKEVLTYRPDAEQWYEQVVFRNYRNWWEPGVDIYDRFIAPTFEETRFSFTVQGGQAQVELKGVPLCAMVVYPAKLDAAMSVELDQIRSARRRSVSVRFERPYRETPVGLGDHDRRRGYAVFSRDPAKLIFPGSSPQDGEIVTQLAGFASPGEYEPFTFSIYPMRGLGTVNVSVSDLIGPGGSRIESSMIDVGVVRYVEAIKSSKEYLYRIKPGPIQPRNPMPVPPGVTVRWWLRLHVPADARPGIYRGRIRIAPDRAQESDLELTVRVIPVELGSTPIPAGLYHFDKTFWYIYWWRGAFRGRDDWLREQTFQHERDDFRLLREYGLNSVSFQGDLRGQVEVAADGGVTFRSNPRFVQWMDLYAEAGMGPMPWYGFISMCGVGRRKMYGHELAQFSPEWERAYRGIISWVKETGRDRSWPEVIFYLSDELSNRGAKGAEFGRELVDVTQDISNIRTIASMNGKWEQIMLPGLKIAMPNHGFSITDESVAEMRKAGCDVWFYNIGNSRVTWGLYLWRMGATGRYQWHHRFAINEPWNAFDGDTRYALSWVTPGKPLPTPALHIIREGIDDLRYVKALEKAIDEAREPRNAAAAAAAEAAQKDLDRLRALIPGDARVLLRGMSDARESGGPVVGNLANSRYLDQQRWTIANHILKIQAALGQ